ncbi:MAG: hypothetical protein DSM106950_02290 [Stigonema ocellatum SAG 48.90 = DSM 106950]|nr:hypothetical protein [Stigonema ocellatum SAG 48.90 = DSM 106950]
MVNPQALEIGLELTTREINSFKYQDNFTRKIYKAEKCNKIYPPIFYQEIIEIIQTEKEEIKRHKQKDGSLEQQPREQQRPPLDVGSDLQVDNVQSFVEVIGDNCNLWRLLVGRIVTHTLQRKRGRVSAWGSKSSEISVDFGFKTAQLKYKEITRYKKDIFIREFNEIFPPLALKEILKSIQIHHEAERAQSERWAKERQEIERQEAQKLEAQKREIERQEAQKLEVQKREIERQEAQRLEAERQKKEVEKREAEKQTLLKNLKEHFERDFLHAHNFYQAKCTEHISFKEKEEHRGDIFTPAVLRLLNKALKEDKEVVLLSRKNSLNSLPWYVNYARIQKIPKNCNLDSFLKLLRFQLPEDLRQKVTISTAHKYKGLEKKVVIVLDAVPRCYPLLHPDLMFTRVFGDNIEQVVEEERRLFYVVLTRAVENLFIITETNNRSPFLEDLQKRKTISTLNWSDYPPLLESTNYITVRVGNQDGRGSNPTCTIRELLKVEGYRWNTNGWNAWCCIYPIQHFSAQELFAKAMWISRADGIEVRFYDNLENMLAIYRVDGGQLTCVVDNISNPIPEVPHPSP